MYEYIRGRIAQRNPAFVVMEAAGIGYHIKISLNTYEQLSGKEECTLLLHFAVREDAQVLYGFFDEEERSMFRSLITVSGIGTSTAILVLSYLKTSELKNAITTGNISLLKAVKGVGQKTAQRLIVELQDTLKKSGKEEMLPGTGSGQNWQEAVAALAMLGFKRIDAERIVSAIMKEHPSGLNTEEIIKLSLKQL